MKAFYASVPEICPSAMEICLHGHPILVNVISKESLRTLLQICRAYPLGLCDELFQF